MANIYQQVGGIPGAPVDPIAPPPVQQPGVGNPLASIYQQAGVPSLEAQMQGIDPAEMQRMMNRAEVMSSSNAGYDPEIARLQNRSATMGPTLRDAFTPSDPNMGPQPLTSIPEGIPDMGTGYIQMPDGSVSMVGGGPQTPQGGEAGGAQMPPGTPWWAYPLQTQRVKRPGQPDLEITKINNPNFTPGELQQVSKLAPMFGGNISAMRDYVLQATGKRLPLGYMPDSMMQERRAQIAGAAVASAAATKATDAQEKVRQTGIAVDRAYDATMGAFNDRMTMVNDLVQNVPGLSDVTGQLYQYKPTWAMWSDEARRAVAQIEQLQGQTFIAALTQLKEAGGGSTGLGQVTEIEGKKIQDAMAKLQRYQSTPDFLAELQRYQAQLTRSMQNIHAAYLANKGGFGSVREMEAANAKLKAEQARRASGK